MSSFVGFFGPRQFSPRGIPTLSAAIAALPADTCVISGGAQGFDFAAAHLAVARGLDVLLVLPTRQYLDYYYWGKGFQPQLIGQPASMDALLTSHLVSVSYVAPPFTKGSNFLRNTAVANSSDVGVTVSAQPTTVGTKHGLSEFFRLGKTVTFLQ